MDIVSANRTGFAKGGGRLDSARSLRVLMIAPTSFFSDYGCHVRILEEARILQKLHHRVSIVTYRNGGPVADVIIRRTLPIPWRQNYEVGSSRHKIGFDMLLGLKSLELLARQRFDIIHAHLHEGALLGTVLSKLFQIPMVFDFQGSLTGEMIDHHFLEPRSAIFEPLLRLETWLDRSAPIVFTSSMHARRLLLEEFGCKPERVKSLPDCVNADFFKPASEFDPAELAALRTSLGIPPQRKLIVYLGLLAEYQGIGLLLEALAGILANRRDVHLLLMGFPSVAFYQQRAIQLGIENFVTFTGRIPYQQAPAYLALGDAAVAPKLSLTEGSGKLLNYMAAALPTVAFDTPVAREYLGSDGILAIPGSVDSLADCLRDCLFPPAEMQSLYRRVGQRLRHRAIQRFSWAPVGRQIVDAYRCLLGDAPDPAVTQ
jgi:glycosyltransferase involved in cell wall biosynthesis